MDYKFGQKNHWRRTAWNAITERISVKPRDAIVLYLGGPMDLDRPTAISKGYRSDNLFFIDQDRNVVLQQRADGKPAIHGDIIEVAKAWPASMPIDVLFCDFCAGLNARLVDDLVVAALLPQLRNTVFATNFLRGRDPSTNGMRATLISESKTKTKHRGLLFYGAHTYSALGLLTGTYEIGFDGAGHGLVSRDTERPIDEQKRLCEMIDAINPILERHKQLKHLEYRSVARQTFDTAIFKNAFGSNVFSFDANMDDALIKSGAGPMRRQIAAVMAHRTRRMSV